jgi:hypothetical protein
MAIGKNCFQYKNGPAYKKRVSKFATKILHKIFFKNPSPPHTHTRTPQKVRWFLTFLKYLSCSFLSLFRQKRCEQKFSRR